MSTAPDLARCSVTLIRDPLHLDRERQAVPCAAGQWLSEVAPPECAAGEWVAVDGGKVIPRSEWDRHLLVPSSEILLYPRTTGTVGKIVSGIVFPPLGVYWALRHAGLPSWASGILTGGLPGFHVFPAIENIMAGKPSAPNVPTTSSDLNSSPTYGFSGITNGTRIGAPIPVVYGEHRVGGQLIGQFVETKDDSDVVNVLLAISEGEIDSINLIEINEQPIQNYTGVTYQVRLGTNNQTAIGLFGNKSAVTIAADSQLTPSFITYSTQGDNLTALVVKVTFPGGLFRMNDSGGFINASVSVEVDYKLTSAGSWTTGPRLTYTDNRRTVLRRQIGIENLTPGRYDVRIRRTTEESTSNRRIDAIRREAVTELVSDQYRYPNTALLAVKALATNQLSGGMPRVTALVLGVKVKQFAYNNTYIVEVTQSPAWVVFDMLTNERYGHGRFTWRTLYGTGTLTVTNGSASFSGTGTGWTAATLRIGDLIHSPSGQAVGIVKTIDYGTQAGTFAQVWGGPSQTAVGYEVRSNDLDIRSFIDWHVFCLEFVPNGRGGTEPRALCDFVFDAERENIWSAVLRICGIGQASAVKTGNYIRIKIEKAEQPVQLFTMGNIKADTFEEIFLPLKERANMFEVQFLNRTDRYRQDMVVLEDPLVFTNSEQPRRKTISGYGITRSSHAARLARFSQRANRYITRTITFETGLDAVACEPGDVIRFQHDIPQWGFGGRALAGSTSSTIALDREVTIESGKTYEVLVRHADDTVETKTVTTTPSTVSTLTISGTWTQTPAKGSLWAFGETLISTKPFRVVTIERTQELDARITAVEYSAALYDESGLNAVNVVQYSALADLMGPPGHVKDLTILEQPDAELSVWVSWSPPGSANFKAANVYRIDSGAPVLLGQSATGSFAVSGLRGGEAFAVKVTSLSSLGGESDYASAPTAEIIVSEVHPPDVPTLVLEGDRLRWKYPNPPRDLAGFLVRFRPGTSRSWESASPAHANLILTTDFKIFGRSGMHTFLVKAVDRHGNESRNAKALTVTFYDEQIDNIVFASDHRAFSWPGQAVNAVDDGGDLAAESVATFWSGDNAPMWSAQSTALMWQAAYAEMTYTVRIRPTDDLLDAVLKIEILMHGEWSVDYLAESSEMMWGDDGAPMWAEDDGAMMWADIGEYIQWPGQLDHLRRQDYWIRVTGHAGSVRAVLERFSVVFDVPDLIERVEQVAIMSGGTRLSLTESYRAILAVTISLEDDGGDAAYALVLDKDAALGPLVKVFDSSDVATTGVIDAVVHGY